MVELRPTEQRVVTKPTTLRTGKGQCRLPLLFRQGFGLLRRLANTSVTAGQLHPRTKHLKVNRVSVRLAANHAHSKSAGSCNFALSSSKRYLLLFYSPLGFHYFLTIHSLIIIPSCRASAKFFLGPFNLLLETPIHTTHTYTRNKRLDGGLSEYIRRPHWAK
jgi:hypothetical protein